MRRFLLVLSIVCLVWGCGGDQGSGAADQGAAVAGPYDKWLASPEDVIKGVMYAYETRDDSLYAALLADDFQYQFEPPGADSTDILTWGREEEVLATGSLFKTPELEGVSLSLHYSEPMPSPEHGMMIPVSGGELRLDVKEKEPTLVSLNRQEIFLSPHPRNKDLWQIVAWHDYPSPE